MTEASQTVLRRSRPAELQQSAFEMRGLVYHSPTHTQLATAEMHPRDDPLKAKIPGSDTSTQYIGPCWSGIDTPGIHNLQSMDCANLSTLWPTFRCCIALWICVYIQVLLAQIFAFILIR